MVSKSHSGPGWMQRRTPGTVIIGVLLVLFGMSTLYPFIHVASVAFSTQAAAARPGFHFWPSEIDASNFAYVITSPEIGVSYLNTIHRTVIGTVLALIVTGLASYALSKTDLPGRVVIMFLFVFTMYFNGGLIPNFLLVRSLGLYNSRWAMILPRLAAAFHIIIFKNFFQSIPGEIEESAKMDGATYPTIFARIIVPLSLPVVATVGLWLAVSHWNAYLDNLVFIQDKSKFVLQRLIRSLLVENDMETLQSGDESQIFPESLKAATILVSTLPILAVYPFIQKYFIKGIMLGSVKG